MQFQIQVDVLGAFVRDQPSDDAPTVASVHFNDRLEKIKDAAVPGWWLVRVVTLGRPRVEGFIRSIQLTEAEAEEIDEKAFFDQISFAARRLSANQDYLFAVASAVSGLSNTTSEGSSAVGPFRFMPETWDELVNIHGDENDITTDDIKDLGAQAVFAAILSVDAQNKLNDNLGRTPTISQLYLAHLFGIEAAASILTGDRQIQIERALRDFYSSKPGGAEFADKIINSNLSLATGKTVEQALDAVVDPLDAGLEKAATLAAELGLEPQEPISSGFSQDLRTAFRTALQQNEIGDDTPYKLSFAGKGQSGASFGFMQGDLAINQPEVKAAFRRALQASHISNDEISRIMGSLSVHVTGNPLSDADTRLVNNALDTAEGHKLVDAMDENIFEDVCSKLNKCIDIASASNKKITPKAQIYIVLWINMSGAPTKLLDWLSGKAVSLTKSVPAPGATVDGTAVENYLEATKFFTENERNLQHIKESAAEGAKLLGGAVDIAPLASIPSVGAVRLTAERGVDLEETVEIKQLVAIVGEASKVLPDGYRVHVFSAMRRRATVAGTGGISQHALGKAIDIQIMGPSGAVPDTGADPSGLYQRLAIAAFHANETMFPARSGQLAWGGNFTTGPADGPRDLMHFDYGGDRGHFGKLAEEASRTTATV
jgi:hypothetical protein